MLSNIQPKIWIFQFLRTMQLFRKHYLDTIIIIDTYI